MLQHESISLHYDGLYQIHSYDNTNAFFHWRAAGFVHMRIIKGPQCLLLLQRDRFSAGEAEVAALPTPE